MRDLSPRRPSASVWTVVLFALFVSRVLTWILEEAFWEFWTQLKVIAARLYGPFAISADHTSIKFILTIILL